MRRVLFTALALLAAVPASAQPSAPAGNAIWTPPRTADGHPDCREYG